MFISPSLQSNITSSPMCCRLLHDNKVTFAICTVMFAMALLRHLAAPTTYVTRQVASEIFECYFMCRFAKNRPFLPRTYPNWGEACHQIPTGGPQQIKACFIGEVPLIYTIIGYLFCCFFRSVKRYGSSAYDGA